DLRRHMFGFVFQRYNLLDTATAAENVEIPAIYAGRRRRERLARAHDLLGRLGLGDRTAHRPSELSGGQQQRVSIARALVDVAPATLPAEPTGPPDSRSGQGVLAPLADRHRAGRPVILVTHDPGVAARAERLIQVRDGRIVEDSGPVTTRAAAPVVPAAPAR